MPDKNLGNATLRREVQYLLRRISTAQDCYFGTKLSRIFQILFQDDSVLFRKCGLLYVHDMKFTLKAVSIAAPALQHLGSIGSWSHANQNALLHAPGLIHPMRP